MLEIYCHIVHVVTLIYSSNVNQTSVQLISYIYSTCTIFKHIINKKCFKTRQDILMIKIHKPDALLKSESGGNGSHFKNCGR